MPDRITRSTLFIEGLLHRLDEIEEQMGNEWPEFKLQLNDLLRDLYRAGDDKEAWEAVDRLLELGLASRASGLFNVSYLVAEKLQAGRRYPPGWRYSRPTRGYGSRPPLRPLTGPGPRPMYRRYSGRRPGPSPRQTQRLTRDALNRAVRHLGMALEQAVPQAIAVGGELEPQPEPVPTLEHGLEGAKGIVPPETAPSDKSRFLNAGFFTADSDDPLPVDQPLVRDDGPYRLGVNVGEFWGPGAPGEAVLDGILDEAFEEQDLLTLQVAVRSRRARISPRTKPLEVAREGNSPLVFFDLTFPWGGRISFNIDLLYQGHLLQSRHVEVSVLQKAGHSIPAGQVAQDGYPTFSRAGTLTRASLTALEERPSRLTITVQRQDEYITLSFYDMAGGALGMQQTKLTNTNLGTQLEKTRKALQAAMNHYKGRIGGDLDEFRLSLWQLADVGSDFYQALLPSQYDPLSGIWHDEPVDLGLTPGQVIQVAPLSAQAGVPWEVLYEHPIEPYRKNRPDRVTLCPDFLMHEPDACPHQYNHRVVCPHGFWGYRYIIEQLPNRVPRGQSPELAKLALQVRNDLPLRLVALVYSFKNLSDHLDALQAMTDKLDLRQVTTLEGTEQALTDTASPADILYFYVHGGFSQDEPALTIGGPKMSESFQFKADDLAAWIHMDLSLRQPLVVLNACESASYGPEHVESLVEEFARKGAAGMIGTQCQVPTTLADDFIRRFFGAFLGRKTVGQALFEARQALLHHKEEMPGGTVARPDPRGLAYSLFATADIKLAQPLLE